MVNGKPFVSTFEGTDFIDKWDTVRGDTKGIYLVPDWASLGPDKFKSYVGKVDGACKDRMVYGARARGPIADIA